MAAHSLPGESHGQRSLAGYSPRGHKELDTTEVTWHARIHSTDLSKTINKEKDKRGKRRKAVGRHTL